MFSVLKQYDYTFFFSLLHNYIIIMPETVIYIFGSKGKIIAAFEMYKS